MRVTAHDLQRFGMIDELIVEPVPAHEAPRDTIQTVGERIEHHLNEVIAQWDKDDEKSITAMLDKRYDKYRVMGAWTTV